MTKMIFIGLSHSPRSARLFYREMKFLKDSIENIDLYFLMSGRLASYEDILEGRIPDTKSKKGPSRISELLPNAVANLLRSFAFKVFQAMSFLKNLSLLYRAKPDVIQASDVREIRLALVAKLLTGARAIYDSHEDYYNQVYEYGGKTARAFLKAFPHKLNEVLLLRFFDSVFCTDDYLYGEYQRKLYGCSGVFLLRNFPLSGNAHAKPLYEEKNTLGLVYIGGVNEYRGLREAAAYVQAFNEKYAPCKKITLTVYSGANKLVDEISKSKYVYHRPWTDYKVLLEKLANYDVGICLWKDIVKFRRNLPLKNFDYMAVGLPIITSNFGGLLKYATLSESAICIDPESYEQFEAAVLRLFDACVRQQLGENGRKYVKEKASFEKEGLNYLAVVGGD